MDDTSPNATELDLIEAAMGDENARSTFLRTYVTKDELKKELALVRHICQCHKLTDRLLTHTTGLWNCGQVGRSLTDGGFGWYW